MLFLALIWGLIAGSAVVVGALLGWLTDLPPRTVAASMAFGSGVLIAVAAFEILIDAHRTAGLLFAGGGFLIGAAGFTTGLMRLDRAGARHRKRPTMDIGGGREAAGVVALATVIDTLPESVIIGLNFSNGKMLALGTVAAVFLSNIPESLSATMRMRRAGHRPFYAVAVWGLVILVTSAATVVGYVVFRDLPPEGIAVTQAIAAGGLVVLVSDTMIPEAFSETHEFAGLVTALGFLAGFALAFGL
jgi:ZIP family zinc transporter